MIDRVLAVMTDEQKKLVIDAKPEDIVVRTEGNGKGLFRGLLNVAKKGNKNVCYTVARTELVFDDDAEASDVMEEVANAILDSAPKKKKLAKKKPAAAPKKKGTSSKKKSDSSKKKSPSKKKVDTWEFYQDVKEEWRWRLIGSNGRIIGAATEGYVNRIDCEKNAERNGWKGVDG